MLGFKRLAVCFLSQGISTTMLGCSPFLRQDNFTRSQKTLVVIPIPIILSLWHFYFFWIPVSPKFHLISSIPTASMSDSQTFISFFISLPELQAHNNYLCICLLVINTLICLNWTPSLPAPPIRYLTQWMEHGGHPLVFSFPHIPHLFNYYRLKCCRLHHINISSLNHHCTVVVQAWSPLLRNSDIIF